MRERPPHIGTTGFSPERFRQHLRAPLDDSPDEDLLSQLPACSSFIHDSLSEGGVVLVQCYSGTSRSVAVRASGWAWEGGRHQCRGEQPHSNPATTHLHTNTGPQLARRSWLATSSSTGA